MSYKYTQNPEGNITLEDLKGDFQEHICEPRKQGKQSKVDFPLDVLPPSLKLFIEEAEKVYGIHPNFMAPAILYASAIAIGKTHILQIKRGYTESAVLWLVLVGDPGVNKSGALKQALAPISNWQKETFNIYKEEKSKYEALAEMSKKERQEANGDSDLGAPPHWEQRYTNDTTPEALAEILQHNPAGVSIYRDELAGWFKSFDRYSKGAEQEQMLSLWSLSPLVINRKSGEPINIHRPCVSVGGTIQPAVIEGIGKDGRSENGFTDRFLFAWPNRQEKPLRTNAEMPEGLTSIYAEGIIKILKVGFEDAETHTPYLVKFTSEAGERFLQYSNEYIKPMCDSAEDSRRKSLFTKFDIHTPRLALILQILWWAFEGKSRLKIENETMERAIKTAAYFLNQSERVFGWINPASPVDRLPEYKQKIYEALPNSFNKAEGVAIAEKYGMKDRAFGYFLADHTQPGTGKPRLFEQPRKRGEYVKIY